MLEIKNIKKSFGQTHVLHDVSLSVNKGDVIAMDLADQERQHFFAA